MYLDDPAEPPAPVPRSVRRRRPERDHAAAPDDDRADAGAVLPQRPVLPRAGREGRGARCWRSPTTRRGSTNCSGSRSSDRRPRRTARSATAFLTRYSAAAHRHLARGSHEGRVGRARPRAAGKQRVPLPGLTHATLFRVAASCGRPWPARCSCPASSASCSRRTPADPLAPKKPHSPREGEGRHLPVHDAAACRTSIRSTRSRSSPPTTARRSRSTTRRRATGPATRSCSSRSRTGSSRRAARAGSR